MHSTNRTTLATLRLAAVRSAFPPPATLAEVLARDGFVQADPIRAPARAQDLILRQRVSGYRAGELERRYPRLGLEEAFLHAHGFIRPDLHALLHPRHDPEAPGGVFRPTGLAAEVLAHVRQTGTTHPSDLVPTFGRARERNNWGGQSQATTRALDMLHHHGFLRVAGRRNGIRLYAVLPDPTPHLDLDERLARLALAMARILAPVPQTTMLRVVARLVRMVAGPPQRRDLVDGLVRDGRLTTAEVDGVHYLTPADQTAAPDPPPRRVRFVAPFDPLVWCRDRFAHLWGWEYRFEAYTPPAKRVRGYYAMPLLWGDAVIGWVTVERSPSGIDVRPGFVAGRPQGHDFARAFDTEVARMAAFLGAEPDEPAT